MYYILHTSLGMCTWTCACNREATMAMGWACTWRTRVTRAHTVLAFERVGLVWCSFGSCCCCCWAGGGCIFPKYTHTTSFNIYIHYLYIHIYIHVCVPVIHACIFAGTYNKHTTCTSENIALWQKHIHYHTLASILLLTNALTTTQHDWQRCTTTAHDWAYIIPVSTPLLWGIYILLNIV